MLMHSELDLFLVRVVRCAEVESEVMKIKRDSDEGRVRSQSPLSLLDTTAHSDRWVLCRGLLVK